MKRIIIIGLLSLALIGIFLLLSQKQYIPPIIQETLPSKYETIDYKYQKSFMDGGEVYMLVKFQEQDLNLLKNNSNLREHKTQTTNFKNMYPLVEDKDVLNKLQSDSFESFYSYRKNGQELMYLVFFDNQEVALFFTPYLNTP